ncbi:DUF2975 domain-containing protein [Bradyrhizobium roseum]|uniref:DUF2975 domain-containing protein n=1 Tax=Bradyrhizobium roseum TaxID=3056648 RepID=UPI00262F3EF6|nr:DUF2975 domain-containing protein [Bradyrhizobium roseus]WKA25551.1 DUF2975 domain-containing protein [Bradyrhizobium roseus]
MTAFERPDRLRRFSKAMAMLTTLGMLLIAAAMIAVFFIPDWTRNLLLARLGQAGQGLSLSTGHLTAAAAITAVPVGVLLFGLWQVRALFLKFADGQVFTLASARLLRHFAGSVLAQAILGPVSSTALMLAFTLNNPSGTRQLVITLSSHDYLALIVGGVLLAVSSVMVEATRIADENASFV